MDRDALATLQAPLKAAYRGDAASSTVRAEGDVDFRGTPARMTERYCAVWQSLRQPPEGSVSISQTS